MRCKSAVVLNRRRLLIEFHIKTSIVVVTTIIIDIFGWIRFVAILLM